MTDAENRKTGFREKGRVEVGWNVRILTGERDSGALQGELTDIGMGGASLAAPRGVPAGTVLTLRIEPPGRAPLAVPAVVRWISESVSGQPVRMGVAFEGLEPRLAAQLAEVLSAVPQILDLSD